MTKLILRAGVAALATAALALGPLAPAWASTPTPTPVPVPTPTHTAPDNPWASEPGTGQILGNVYTTVASNPWVQQPVAGATVTAYTINSAGKATAQASVLSGRTGDYLFTNLPAGTYYLKFDKLPASAGRVPQWLMQTALAPHGRSTAVADQASVQEYAEELRIPIVFSGSVSCELCTAPPDPATTSVELWALDYGTTMTRLQAVRPSAAGRYSFASVFPAANSYEVHVVYTGRDSFAKLSSVYVGYAPGSTYPLDLIEARQVSKVAGVDPFFVAQLHANYADFLHRAATDTDVANWSRASEGYDGRAAYLIATSDEARLIRIDAAYSSILNRTSDAGGRLNWLNAIRSGALRADDLFISLYGSQEYFQAHGGTNTGYVAALYKALVGRTGTPSDWSFWAAQIAQHGRAWVAGQFWNTPEATLVRMQADYTYFTGSPARGDEIDEQLTELAVYGEEEFRASLATNGRATLRYHVG
ncbi:DUF4214 domain-containing protein [Subtercola boreus]|uniref:DUF4214 domain-containing protein n=1 Tax=Subtercola boreus TaxID=120213 RepID=UPI001150491A|nr:DUF4214 domain-containing protein [Subtercola boreus]